MKFGSLICEYLSSFPDFFQIFQWRFSGSIGRLKIGQVALIVDSAGGRSGFCLINTSIVKYLFNAWISELFIRYFPLENKIK